jgi:hypothetical protein
LPQRSGLVTAFSVQPSLPCGKPLTSVSQGWLTVTPRKEGSLDIRAPELFTSVNNLSSYFAYLSRSNGEELHMLFMLCYD